MRPDLGFHKELNTPALVASFLPHACLHHREEVGGHTQSPGHWASVRALCVSNQTHALSLVVPGVWGPGVWVPHLAPPAPSVGLPSWQRIGPGVGAGPGAQERVSPCSSVAWSCMKHMNSAARPWVGAGQGRAGQALTAPGAASRLLRLQL